MYQGLSKEFLWSGSQVNRLVKKFSIYWGEEETMYGTCHINGTWGSKEVGRLKLSYEGSKPQRGGLTFWGELTHLDTMS